MGHRHTNQWELGEEVNVVAILSQLSNNSNIFSTKKIDLIWFGLSFEGKENSN